MNDQHHAGRMALLFMGVLLVFLVSAAPYQMIDFGTHWRGHSGLTANDRTKPGQAYPKLSYYRCTAAAHDPYASFAKNADGVVVAVSTGHRASIDFGGAIFVEYQIRTQKERPVKVYQVEYATVSDYDSDCHGFTFADGECWILNDQVDSILRDSGWARVPGLDAQACDVGIYRHSDGRIIHSVTVISRDAQGGLLVDSKTGFGPVRRHVQPGLLWAELQPETKTAWNRPPPS